jgi:eukaryotic-like serine/threonine-protein kinase
MTSTQDPGGEAPLYRYRFGGAEFDEVRFQLTVGGLPVDLEQKPLQVLGVLLRHVGEVVTKEELFEHVWNGRPTVDNVLPNAVAKLRKGLGESAAERLVTLPRIGYRLNGPLERTAVGRRMFSRLELEPEQPVPLRPHYALERQLNPPGASEVWLARHVKTREARVFKFASDGERLAMLKREATLYRVLIETLGERDDLVRIIDWNFEAAPFFLECEYGGENLHDWVRGAGGRLASFDRDARLDLFLRIAEAVAAAHAVGVLHKDIKPANVLVAPKGDGWQVRLTDFGSGRLLNPERLAALGITRLGLTVTQSIGSDSSSGTPLYLAPELVAGEPPTVRSDIYALGLLLYQLLVGDLQRPLAPGWEQALDDPLLCEDVAAATYGDPAQRLASVTVLVERLKSLAARREAGERERERERRLAETEALLARSRARRPWMIAAGVVLATGLAVALYQNDRIEHARAEALVQAALATEMNRFLNEDLLGGGRSRTSTIAYDRNPTLRELIDSARLRLDGRFTDAPVVEAGIRTTLARAYRTLGDFTVAETEFRRVAELNRSRLLPQDESRLLGEYDLVTVLVRLSKFDEARQRLDEADALAGPRKEAIGELGLRAKLARGTFHYQQLQPQEALEAYLVAEQMQRVVRPDDAALSAHVRLTIGGAELRLKNPAVAEAIAREVLAGDPYNEQNVGLSTLATARRLLGDALRNQGRPGEAIPHLERAFAEQEQARGPDDQATISTLSSLGYLYSLTGDEARRAELQREVYARSVRRWGADNQYTLVELINLGDAERDVGNIERACAHLAAAAEGLERVAGPESTVLHAARYSHAGALAEARRFDEAAAVASQVDPARLAASSSDASGHAKLAELRGQILLGLGQEAEGRAELERAATLLAENR